MKITPLDPNTRIRPDHNKSVPYTLPHVQPNMVIEGTEVFTASVDLVFDGKVIQKPGDKWLKVDTVNGIPRIGWIAIIDMGQPICKELLTVTLKHTIKVYSDGSITIDGTPYP